MEEFTTTFRRDYPAKKPLGRIVINDDGVTFSWPIKEETDRKTRMWSRTISYDQIEKVKCHEVSQKDKLGDKLADAMTWILITAVALVFLIADLIMHLFGTGILSLGWDLILLAVVVILLVPKTIKANRAMKRFHGIVLQIDVKSSEPLVAVGFDEDIDRIQSADDKLKEILPAELMENDA